MADNHAELAEEGGLEKDVKQEENRQKKSGLWSIAWHAAVAVGATAFGVATTGVLAPIVGGALGAGIAVGSIIRKKPLGDIITGSLRSYAVVNTVLAPVLYFAGATSPIAAAIGSEFGAYVGFSAATGAAAGKIVSAFTATLPVFAASYRAADHLYANYLSPKGLMRAVTQNFSREWLRFGGLLAPALTLSALGPTHLSLYAAGRSLSLPLFALNLFPAGIYHTLRPLPEKKRKEPNEQYKQAPSPGPGPALQPALRPALS